MGQAKLHYNHLDNVFIAGLNWANMLQSKDTQRMIAHVLTFKDSGIDPLCLEAMASASGNPTYTQAMNGPDANVSEVQWTLKWEL
eukprot:2441193-Ditylum_brightwellii.AAC.1